MLPDLPPFKNDDLLPPTSPQKMAPSNEEGWVVSYADLMTLLLTFFVLLISMSSIDQSKFEQVANSISDAIGKKSQPKVTLEQLSKELDAMIDEEGLKGKVQSDKSPTGVAISVPGAYLFRSGSATLNNKAKPLIKRIGELVQTVPYFVAVEGHTDDLPIRTKQFPSNWELSSARASGIVRYFIQLGISSERLSAIGYAETRPIVPKKDSQTGKISSANRAKNRRVVIRFLAY